MFFSGKQANVGPVVDDCIVHALQILCKLLSVFIEVNIIDLAIGAKDFDQGDLNVVCFFNDYAANLACCSCFAILLI